MSGIAYDDTASGNILSFAEPSTTVVEVEADRVIALLRNPMRHHGRLWTDIQALYPTTIPAYETESVSGGTLAYDEV